MLLKQGLKPSLPTEYLQFEESLKPLKNCVVIRQDRRFLARQSGLIIPTNEWPPQFGWVVACSARVEDVLVGDYVLYTIYPGPETKVDDQYYFIINAKDILAIVEA